MRGGGIITSIDGKIRGIGLKIVIQMLGDSGKDGVFESRVAY